ncbi:unnamed protein product, partial [Dovyalis caffra]
MTLGPGAAPNKSSGVQYYLVLGFREIDVGIGLVLSYDYHEVALYRAGSVWDDAVENKA